MARPTPVGLARRALPAELAEVAASHLEEAARLLAALVAEPEHQRRDVLGPQRVDELFREHGLGQARAGDGRDGVDEHAALSAFDRQRVREAGQPELGHRVVRLAEVAVDAGRGGGHDDAAVALLAHVIPGRAGDRVAALHVDAVDEVPVLLGHLVEADVAQDAGVVHHHVHAAEGVERGLYDLRAFFHRVVAGDRCAAGFADLLHHPVGRARALSLTVGAAAEIVDHHLRAARTERERVGPTEPAARSGDDHDLVVETKLFRHPTLPVGRTRRAKVRTRNIRPRVPGRQRIPRAVGRSPTHVERRSGGWRIGARSEARPPRPSGRGSS